MAREGVQAQASGRIGVGETYGSDTCEDAPLAAGRKLRCFNDPTARYFLDVHQSPT